jgi:hypothetical protein
LYMQVFGQAQPALERLNHALGLDAKFNFTQGLLGDYYLKIANSSSDSAAKKQAFLTAEGYYRTAADVSKSTDTNSKASYLVSLSNVYIQIASLDPKNIDHQQLLQAINVLLESIKAGLSSSDLWKVQEAIAKMYLELGDKANTVYYANLALAGASNSEITTIQNLITQAQALP